MKTKVINGELYEVEHTSKDNQASCGLFKESQNKFLYTSLELAKECIRQSESLTGKAKAKILIEAKLHMLDASNMLYDLMGDAWLKGTGITFARIREILNKYPNRRVHVAISELIGEDVYNKIKEEL